MEENMIEANTPIGEPIVPEPVVPVEPIVELEKEYRFQPKDEQGRKLGGEQVIKYKTNEELADKLAEQNTFLVRKLREQTRKNRLGISDTENIPEGATKFELPLEFKARQLTPDERVQLSRDLLDPERCEQATNTMFESAVGVTPSVLRDTLSRLSQNEMSLLARVESDAFMAANRDYYKCKENSDAVTGWMIKNNLAPLQQNFLCIYNNLKKDDVLLVGGGTVLNTPAPNVPVQEPIVPEVPVSEPIIPVREEILESVVPVPVRTVAPPATGLTRVPSVDGEPPKAARSEEQTSEL